MSNSEKKVILTIDDQEYVRSSIKNFLEDYDYCVIEAENGRIALDIFEHERPDLLLVDLRMPEVDGLEVLAKVREDSPETPVVIISGTGVLGDAVEALRLGAWDYILKPIEDMEVLLHVVSKSLEKARLAGENIRYRQHLEEMVEQRTSELNKANRELLAEIDERKRAEQQREEALKILASKNEELESILYVSTHDLKSPLVNINGFCGELDALCRELRESLESQPLSVDTKEKIAAITNDAIPEALVFITGGALKMKYLLDGVLKVSRSGRTELNIEKLEMNRLIETIRQSVNIQIKAKNISFTVGDLPDCLGDSVQINQVFTNLVDNALKFLEPDHEGQIDISGWVEEGRSIYCVKDNGIGIEPGCHKKIFELFHRLNPQEGIGGEGIGLTIVQRILDRQRGKVWVESEVGKGSRFFVSLPCC